MFLLMRKRKTVYSFFLVLYSLDCQLPRVGFPKKRISLPSKNLFLGKCVESKTTSNSGFYTSDCLIGTSMGENSPIIMTEFQSFFK